MFETFILFSGTFLFKLGFYMYYNQTIRSEPLCFELKKNFLKRRALYLQRVHFCLKFGSSGKDNDALLHLGCTLECFFIM